MPFRMALPGHRECLLREELDRVVEILKGRGVQKINLFGTLADGKVGPCSPGWRWTSSSIRRRECAG